MLKRIYTNILIISIILSLLIFNGCMKMTEEINQSEKSEETIKKENNTKAIALISKAHVYLEAGQKDEALKILSQATDEAEKIESYAAYYGAAKAHALTGIAVSYVKAGQDSKALEIIEKIDGDYAECDKAVALYSISNTYIESKQIDKALDTLNKALEIVEKEGKCFMGGDVSLLEQIAISYSKVGKEDKTLEILSKDIKEEEK